MERSRNSLSRLAVFAFVAMAAVVGCAAETSPDPTPGGEANLNPQPLPPSQGGDDKNARGDDDDSSETATPGSSGETSSGASGSSGQSSGTSGSSSGGSSSGNPPDAGKE